jgi:hypothetical protein
MLKVNNLNYNFTLVLLQFWMSNYNLILFKLQFSKCVITIVHICVYFVLNFTHL